YGPVRGRSAGILRAGARGVPRARAAGAATYPCDRRVCAARSGGRAGGGGACAAAELAAPGLAEPGSSAVTPGWLGPEIARLRSAYAAGRLPHALLIHEAPGAAGDWLAAWAARMVLCSNRQHAPCEGCGSCHRA